MIKYNNYTRVPARVPRNCIDGTQYSVQYFKIIQLTKTHSKLKGKYKLI